jgi:peptidoglycan biosynthesis protein MviN/MurJ (putative lipid II flippase)
VLIGARWRKEGRKEAIVNDARWSTDRRLGRVGFWVAGVGFVLNIVITANAEPPLQEVATSAIGVAIIALFLTITLRHRSKHPHGGGHPQMIAAWVLVVLAAGWIVLVSLDPGLAGDSWLDRLPNMGELMGIAALMLPIPLALASGGLLRDLHDEATPPGSHSPTPA